MIKLQIPAHTGAKRDIGDFTIGLDLGNDACDGLVCCREVGICGEQALFGQLIDTWRQSQQ